VAGAGVFLAGMFIGYFANELRPGDDLDCQGAISYRSLLIDTRSRVPEADPYFKNQRESLTDSIERAGERIVEECEP